MKVLISLSFLLVAVAADIKPLGSFFNEGRIIGGSDASRNQFPYQVGLVVTKGEKSSWCGGSLISNQWILTAAHCTKDMVKIVAYLGVTKVQLTQDEVQAGGQKFTITNQQDIITHAQYINTASGNDIALIKLPSAVTFTEYIQSVKLPASASIYPTYTGKEVVASGWGRTSDLSTGITDTLQFVDLTILDQPTCAQAFNLGYVKSSNICVKTTDGKSPCSGDSGGPLVLKSEKIQIGITSFGSSKGCEKGFPGVFARVTSFLPWISQNTGLVF